jgi:large subunit ribosomal protein L31
MKPGIHPEKRNVLFRDVSCGWEIVVASTVATKETATYEGVEYPLFKVEISSASHPFYNQDGKKVADTAGSRMDKFRKRFGGMSKVLATPKK